jgi:triosephosphate isomerase
MVAGNWKMNLRFEEAVHLTEQLVEALEDNVPEGVSVVLAPPFPYLQVVNDLTQHCEAISVAAQNCHSAPSGAFTGEVSAPMLSSLGLQAVILGHSERRALFGETNASLATKVDAAFDAELAVIFCVGETLAERKSGQQTAVVQQQLTEALGHLNAADWDNLVIAYEPVWAIGTGETASPAQAQDMHAHIRQVIRQLVGSAVAEATPILYGGSVKASNAAELFAQPDVDGGLVGGASLQAEEFVSIVQAIA